MKKTGGKEGQTKIRTKNLKTMFIVMKKQLREEQKAKEKTDFSVISSLSLSSEVCSAAMVFNSV